MSVMCDHGTVNGHLPGQCARCAARDVAVRHFSSDGKELRRVGPYETRVDTPASREIASLRTALSAAIAERDALREHLAAVLTDDLVPKAEAAALREHNAEVERLRFQHDSECLMGASYDEHHSCSCRSNAYAQGLAQGINRGAEIGKTLVAFDGKDERVDTLEAALRKYGRHYTRYVNDHDCPLAPYTELGATTARARGVICTCGLDAALAAGKGEDTP